MREDFELPETLGANLVSFGGVHHHMYGKSAIVFSHGAPIGGGLVVAFLALPTPIVIQCGLVSWRGAPMQCKCVLELVSGMCAIWAGDFNYEPPEVGAMGDSNAIRKSAWCTILNKCKIAVLNLRNKVQEYREKSFSQGVVNFCIWGSVYRSHANKLTCRIFRQGDYSQWQALPEPWVHQELV